MKKYVFIIEGLRCQACASSVNHKLSSLNGVNSFSLNLLSGILNVELDENVAKPEDIIIAVNSLGFKIHIKNSSLNRLDYDHYYKFYQLIILLVCGLFLLYISLTNMLMDQPFVPDFINMNKNPIGFTITCLVLALPIITIGFKFYIPGFKYLFRLHPNMDSLVTIASLTSFIYSLVYTILIIINPAKPQYLMNIIYESSCIVIVLVYLGKYVEQSVKNKAKGNINSLINIIPTNANVERNNKIELVCVNEVNINEILVIKAGERIPVDGEIIQGEGDLDSSAVTGESNLKVSQVGEQVLAGSILVSGLIKIKAIKISSDATLNHILTLVSQSSISKSKTSKIIDKTSLFFVPITMVISIIVFIVWACIQPSLTTALSFFMSTLTIACPCAIGLATPLANVLSSLRAMNLGFIYKNMDIVSKFKNIDYVVFDKTGTLTSNLFDVQIEEIYSKTLTKYQIITLLASIEANMNHPISESIINYAKENNVVYNPTLNFNYLVGLGLKSTIGNKTYYIGNKKLLRSLGIESYYIENGTTLYLVENNEVLAKILLKERLKKGAERLIRFLKSKGIKTMMLTGDNEISAKNVSETLGLDEYFNSLLPSDKYEIIKELQENHKVMYIGDGINDAPSLALADISVAAYKSSDIANDNSDIYLLNDDISVLIKAIKLGSFTYSITITNIVWAFLYNIIAMIFASGIFYSLGIKLEPWMSASAMALSSICVVLTSLFIKVKKIDKKL